MLDEKEAAIENKQVESAKQMGVDTATLNTALEEGTEGVHLGSQVYKDTMNSMKRYEQLLDKHANEEGKIDKKSFTPQELDEMIGLLQTAERGSTEYLRGKEEKNLVKNPKTARPKNWMNWPRMQAIPLLRLMKQPRVYTTEAVSTRKRRSSLRMLIPC